MSEVCRSIRISPCTNNKPTRVNKNVEIVEEFLKVSSDESFLESHPRGAYTAFTTYHGRFAVPSLEFHRGRLQNSQRILSRDVYRRQCCCRLTEDEELMERVMKEGVKRAIRELGKDVEREEKEKIGEAVNEGVIIILFPIKCCVDPKNSDEGDIVECARGECDELLIYGKERDGRKRTPDEEGTERGFDVEVCNYRRQNAPAKDSYWKKERSGLEKQMRKECTEVLLSKENEKGEVELLEGLVTNLFVVIGSKIYVADDNDVLGGYVRELVLKACNDIGLQVVKQGSTLRSIESWDAAFISNEVRDIVLIDGIWIEENFVQNAKDGDQKWERKSVSTDKAGLVQQLRVKVRMLREEELSKLC